MADRYWVGGTGNWDTTSTTNWSATSGGAGGASVPTVADNVFFDQAGTYFVNMAGALACLDITVSAGTVSFAQGASPTLEVRGSLSILATTSISQIPCTFTATTTGKTVNTNGSTTTSTDFIFNGVGGEWTLASAVTLGNNTLTVTNGTFNSGNYAISVGSINTNNANVRTINLGSSTVTITGGFGLFFNTQTNLTFNAGTSQINFTASSVSPQIQTGVTFYNVAFTSSGTKTIIGANTFNNLAVTAPASAGVTTLTFAAQQTINGTLSTTGTAGNRRVFFASATYGISYDLVVNSAPSLTDADFRGLYVRGTAAPISGTRIGNRGECRGITFSTPKTVYWNLAIGGSWTDNAWATSSGGAVNTDNFPLPQDTATIVNTGLNTSNSISLSSAIPYTGTVDMSARTNAMVFSFGGGSVTVYGNWIAGSGTSYINSNTLTFSGGTTQTITSAGKTFSCPITVDTYGGTVQLADALTITNANVTVTNGTFNTQGYAVAVNSLSSTNSNVRTITLGASAVTLTNNIDFTVSTNLTFNAGTSTITFTNLNISFLAGSQTYYNVTFSDSSWPSSHSLYGNNTFNNFTLTAPAAEQIITLSIYGGTQTINGTLTCSGATAVRRVMVRSDTLGTQRTLNVNSISATDCDFRDINLTGAAAGASPTRAGNCGGNSGITFPAAKTVYWNLTGTQNWSAVGWAPSSGGTPDINQFPLAQDTAVFDNTGAVGTTTIQSAWNIGTIDSSSRTSAMTLSVTSSPFIYGDLKIGTGVTVSGSFATWFFAKPGTQTITSNGVTLTGCSITTLGPTTYLQLADALTLPSNGVLTVSRGTFDAVTYNVTTGSFVNSANNNTIKMGSGTWTLSGVNVVWDFSVGANALVAGTSTIVLSNTSSLNRSFAGGSFYYNKLTIGGATGSAITSISGSNTFGELASTKTVAYNINFSLGSTQTVGKWSISGTAGNLFTIRTNLGGSAFTLVIVGPANTGIDYLSVRDCTVSTTSPGEFYVGANSTNVSNNTNVIFTATPAARTLYWVGGTGNWSSTTKWSTSSGGGSGAAIPTSLDAVVFDSASNATAYTATIDAGVTIARCASFTMAGPASGNVTFAGSTPMAFHGTFSLAATGITRTYSGNMNFAGNGSYTFTTNGVTLNSLCTVVGIDSTWTLGSNCNIGNNNFLCNAGTFALSTYTLTSASFRSLINAKRTINCNSGAIVSTSSSVISFGSTDAFAANLEFNAGTSTITATIVASVIFEGNGKAFNTVNFTNPTNVSISGVNTFGTLSFGARTAVGITPVTFSANQTITTLTLNAGTASAFRTFLASDTIGTQRTLTVTTLTAGAADYDFRDIAITGGAAPISGTRFGDCKGNSGITFPAAKTVYYRQTGSADWGATGTGSWSATSGGALDATQFPLAQDTAVFPAATYPASGSTTTVNANYNIGTIDMSLRTANTMTLATSTNTPTIYGNWINGTGTTLTGTSLMTFAGRGTQTITSAGKTFTQAINVQSPGGNVLLGDALLCNNSGTSLRVNSGTFDANGYNVTLSNGGFSLSVVFTGSRNVNVGSGTWVLGGTSFVWDATAPVGITVTGTGTISLTSASAKTFAGGGISYSGITLNQGGAGTLTITGNNTFKDITNTYSATGATTISLGNTSQTVTQFTGTGTSGKVLTISGASASSPGTLIIVGTPSVCDYINVSNVRGYPVNNIWKIGVNSTNSGSLGFEFVAPPTVYASTIAETATITEQIFGGLLFVSTINETTTGTDNIAASGTFYPNVLETTLITDQIPTTGTFNVLIDELSSAAEQISAAVVFQGSISESGAGTDQILAGGTFNGAVNETSSVTDLSAAQGVFQVVIQETGAGNDQINAQGAFSAVLVETSTTIDAAAANINAVATINELSTVTDAVLGAYLWNLINDGQSVAWTNVNSNTPNPWTVIDDNQSPGWQNT